MIKNARLTALLSSFVISFNTLSGGINEIKVFAEEEILPNIKDALESIDVNNDSDNEIDQPVEPSVPDNPEVDDSEPSVPDNPEVEDSIPSTPLEPSIPTVPSTPLEPSTPIQPSANLINSSVSTIKDNIYYTKDDKISFTFNINNVSNIKISSKEQSNFKYTIGNYDKFIKGNVTVDFYSLKPHDVNDVTITFKNGKTSKDINISFIYDNESPKISFNKTEDVPFGDDINKEDGVYYFYSENQNSFDEKFTIYVKANDNIDIKHTTFEVDANINKQDLGNGLYKLTISNIKENKVNTLKVSSTDFAGNTTEKEFKFFKDTARAQVKLDLSSNENIQVYNNKYYIHKDVEELSLDLQLNHVENAKDFSIENNIKIDDKIVAEYDPDSDSEDLSAELIKVNDNKYKLVLRNIEGNKDYKLEFVNLKDNDSNKFESSIFNIIKDITAPKLTLAGENKGISFVEGNTLHVKYDDKSPELSFSSDEDVTYSFEYEDDNNIIDQSKIKDKTESSVIKNLVFSKDGSAKITVTATDYSGNETSATYTLVMDSTDYSKNTFNDYINATVSGKVFENNILYLYNNETAEHTIIFNYENESKDKFIMYDSKGKEISDSQHITLRYGIDGNDYTYKLVSKNGSFDESNTYKVYYTNKRGFDVQFTYADKAAIIENGGLYSSSDKNTFNFKATITDSKFVEIKEVKATIKYTKPNDGVKTKSITVPTNSKYIKIGQDEILIGKHPEKVNTYELTDELLSKLLKKANLDKFEDGNYTITVEVISEFEYDKADDKVFSVNFNIDSSAPEATLVLKDNKPKATLLSKILKDNNNYVIPDNSGDLYINTTELLVGIKKSDLDSSDLFRERKVTINNKEIHSNHLVPIYDSFEGYELFSIDFEKSNVSKDDFIGLNNNPYKKYDFKVKVTDKVDNGFNNTSKDIKYTVDNYAPDFEIYADSKITDIARSFLKGNKISNAPYIDAKNIIVNLTNESNNTLDTFNQKNNNVFLWFDKKVKSEVKSNDNIPSYNVKELLKINDEGLYEITVEATDKAGNRSESTFYINIDTEKPVINMGFASQPNAVAELKSTIIETIESGSTSTTNNITVEDSMNSADEVTLELYETKFDLLDKPFPGTAAPVGNSMSLDTSSVADGIYNATLTVKDKAGHVSTGSGKITIDGKKPVLSIDARELQTTPFGEDEYTIEHKNLNSVNPVITITDITTKPEDIIINLNARDTKNSKKITVNENNSSLNKYTRTITLPSISQQDVYSLDVITKDELGRKTTSKINFGIDREAPSLSVTAGGKSITEGSMTYLNKQDAKDLVATVNDNILSPEEIKEKTVITLNGVSKSGTKYIFTEDNTYDINITTSDKAGNSTSMNFTIIVDTVEPAVKIENIIEGTYYNKDVLPKIITDDETAVETITLNGKPYTKETTITADNSYTLLAKAEDPAGNIGEATVNFVIDKTSPVIKITNIEENGFYDEGELIPEIIVTDNDVNVETVMFLDNKSYFAGENVSTDGSHVLYVKAVDSASNTTEATVKFKTNFNPPVIKINDIEDGQVFYGPVTLDIEFEDTEKSYIYVNGKEHMNGDVLSKPGKYKLKVSAIDEFESESEETLSFTISENVVIPSTNEKSEFTANTYKLIATSIVAIASIALIGGFFIIKRKKDENANE